MSDREDKIENDKIAYNKARYNLSYIATNLDKIMFRLFRKKIVKFF